MLLFQKDRRRSPNTTHSLRSTCLLGLLELNHSGTNTPSSIPSRLAHRVHLLLSHGITPYLVFDGGYLPAKAGKEEERRSRRESNLQRGMQLTREGNASGAHQFFCKAADVTPFMAHQVIQVRASILLVGTLEKSQRRSVVRVWSCSFDDRSKNGMHARSFDRIFPSLSHTRPTHTYMHTSFPLFQLNNLVAANK